MFDMISRLLPFHIRTSLFCLGQMADRENTTLGRSRLRQGDQQNIFLLYLSNNVLIIHTLIIKFMEMGCFLYTYKD